jgi:GNAT superfamily N-acetyltransferase
MDTTFHLRPATADDVLVIIGLIDRAAAWLRTKDTTQWARPYPDRPTRDARIEQGVASGRTWIAWDPARRRAAATLTVVERAGPELAAFWRELERGPAGLAAFVHRLVIDRSYAGTGLGAELLDWAGVYAARRWGVRWIRIDVWTDNLALHAYYKGLRFDSLGESQVATEAGYPSAALFERRVDRSAATPRLRTDPYAEGPAGTDRSA